MSKVSISHLIESQVEIYESEESDKTVIVFVVGRCTWNDRWEMEVAEITVESLEPGVTKMKIGDKLKLESLPQDDRDSIEHALSSKLKD